MARSDDGTTVRNIWRILAAATAAAGLAAAAILAGLLLANGVDTTVTDDDRQVIQKLDVDEHCESAERFDRQRQCVEQLQHTIFETYPDTSDSFVKGETSHHVTDYHQRGWGSCYDRARLIEQALRDYGFEVRRVALFRRQSPAVGYLKPGIDSHALSEVKTARGWMAVDSVEPFIGADDRGLVYTVGQLRDGLEDGEIDDTTFDAEIPDDFFEGDFVYVYGLYSRHGYFFEPHLPVPEINWSNFRLGG